MKQPLLCSCLLILLFFFGHSSSHKACPNCGSIQVPYPLSTNPNCGDPDYSLRCDGNSQKLYFDGLNGSSYLVLRIMASSQRMVVQPSPWLPQPGTCVTQDMPVSEGLWLNRTLPFKITSANTIFLFNCSPRLLVSPLDCTPSSLCHHYLEGSGHVDRERALQCANGLDPCCTFVVGGMPSAYKIRLHSSGCKAFRSILSLDPAKPPSLWEEGIEIQWVPAPEPVCKTQLDCTRDSTCSPAGGNGLSRCPLQQGLLLGYCSGYLPEKGEKLQIGHYPEGLSRSGFLFLSCYSSRCNHSKEIRQIVQPEEAFPGKRRDVEVKHAGEICKDVFPERGKESNKRVF